MKKYELALGTEKEFYGIKMFRIRALISFSDVKTGDLGGYVQKESNLSQEGNAWVFEDAKVYEDARVSGNAQVCGNAWVCGNAQVHGDARVSGNARVYGNAWVYGDAWVSKISECVNITNQKNNITLTPNLIIIGCKTWKTLAEFETTYKQIGKEHGYTEDEAEITAELVRAVMKRFKPIVTEIKVEHDGIKYKFDLVKAKELGLVK